MKNPEGYSAIELLEISLRFLSRYRQVSSIIDEDTYWMLERVAENVESAIHRLKAGELY